MIGMENVDLHAIKRKAYNQAYYAYRKENMIKKNTDIGNETKKKTNEKED